MSVNEGESSFSLESHSGCLRGIPMESKQLMRKSQRRSQVEQVGPAGAFPEGRRLLVESSTK